MYSNLPDGVTMDEIEDYMGSDEYDPYQIIELMARDFKEQGKTRGQVTAEDVITYIEEEHSMDEFEEWLRTDSYAMDVYNEYPEDDEMVNEWWNKCIAVAVETVNYEIGVRHH